MDTQSSEEHVDACSCTGGITVGGTELTGDSGPPEAWSYSPLAIGVEEECAIERGRTRSVGRS
jgi:hypothetical protein